MPPGLRPRALQRALLVAPLLAVMLGACRSPRATARPTTASPPRQPVAGITLVAHVELPTGLRFGPYEVGGLSGLTYDAAADLFYAVVDDPTEHPPARVLRFRWHPPAAPELVDWLLLTASGQPLPPTGADLEGIVRAADGTLYISSEGNAKERMGPWVGHFAPDGDLLARLPVPATFAPAVHHGIHNN
ncbi:MAG TPA: esterase-like activity of phytase family protein, partial [Thermoanaerobaculia bacterium]|nr:esterase-like activity of phytase family protein [Thermoanaerobaculia bacterium]